VAEIDVERRDHADGVLRFSVRVGEGGTATEHDVSVSPSDLERLGASYATPDAFVEACFAFLLEREPKESILRSFDVSAIGGYFPGFEDAIRRGA
jgi:hypothetical protein